MTYKLICDGCNNDIKYNNPKLDAPYVLSDENDHYHFCNLDCIKIWIDKHSNQNILIDDLELTMRSANCLKTEYEYLFPEEMNDKREYSIKKLLTKLTKKDLCYLPNCGKKSYAEIIIALEEKNIFLEGNVRPEFHQQYLIEKARFNV